jgi:hypothetical protein
LIGYSITEKNWAIREQHSRFNNMLEQPAIQTLLKDIPEFERIGKRLKTIWPSEYADLADAELGRRIKQRYPGLDPIIKRMISNNESNENLRFVIQDYRNRHPPPATLPANFSDLKIGDAIILDDAGKIASLRIANGDRISRPSSEQPSMIRLIGLPIVCLVAGYGIPWGSIKLLVWVVGGFVKRPV